MTDTATPAIADDNDVVECVEPFAHGDHVVPRGARLKRSSPIVQAAPMRFVPEGEAHDARALPVPSPRDVPAPSNEPAPAVFEFAEDELVQAIRGFTWRDETGSPTFVRMGAHYSASHRVVRTHPGEFMPVALDERRKAEVQQQLFREDAEEFNERQRAYYAGGTVAAPGQQR